MKKRTVTRRKLLAMSGVAVAGGVAGCAGSNDGNGDQNISDGNSTKGKNTSNESGNETGNGEASGEAGNETDASKYADKGDGALELSFGETAPTSDGVEITVERPRLTESYTYESSAGERLKHESGSNSLWALARFTGENTSEKTLKLPRMLDFVARIGNKKHNTERYRRADGRYEGGEVPPGTVREGDVLFKVPPNTLVNNLVVVWHDNFLSKGVHVRWSASSTR